MVVSMELLDSEPINTIYGDDVAQQLTQTSLSLGYRNFFASVLVPREEVFICGSVVSNRAKGDDTANTRSQTLREHRSDEDVDSRENLQEFAAGGITYLDMIMLDYPGPNCDSIKGQWQAFEEFVYSY
ncbi:hypothetical protein AK812_SmicGene585 [Symbiodinium microadriaticum]|uniref:Uncharacterized protein n=1 Tax=Symbiodinium microadriaticum TaxID=2951 RepID=A0A1Q9F682_SYMMI|nr:hypothetical protein AK812_SmicGene585 [Symbiodinium microadriaticum]